MAGRKKRYWTDEEKREICAQARLPDASVAQVARRYAVNANMLFKWLKDPRYVAAVQAGAIVASEGHDDFIELSLAGYSPPSLLRSFVCVSGKARGFAPDHLVGRTRGMPVQLAPREGPVCVARFKGGQATLRWTGELVARPIAENIEQIATG